MSGWQSCGKGRESQTEQGLTMMYRCQNGKSSAGQWYSTEIQVMDTIK